MTQTLRDKIAEAVHDAIDSVHDMDVTFDDYAQASADAILSVIAESVEPLVWECEAGWRWKGSPPKGFFESVCKWVCMDPTCGYKCAGRKERFPSLEEAQSAAQADYNRRILSALGLSTPEQEKGE